MKKRKSNARKSTAGKKATRATAPRKKSSSRGDSGSKARTGKSRAAEAPKRSVTKPKNAPAKKAATKKTAAKKAATKQATVKPATAKRATTKKGSTVKAASRKVVKRARKPRGEEVIGSRELIIRGYWDRYPSSDQRKHHKKYDAIPKDHRRGPTAYDLLVRDYNRLSPAERRKIRVRVVYGVAPDTGLVLSAQKIAASKMVLDLPRDREHAYASLQTLLVRAGTVDTPTAWRVNKNAVRVEHDVPVGIEWVIMHDEPAKQIAPQADQPRNAKGRFVSRAK